MRDAWSEPMRALNRADFIHGANVRDDNVERAGDTSCTAAPAVGLGPEEKVAVRVERNCLVIEAPPTLESIRQDLEATARANGTWESPLTQLISGR